MHTIFLFRGAAFGGRVVFSEDFLNQLTFQRINLSTNTQTAPFANPLIIHPLIGIAHLT